MRTVLVHFVVPETDDQGKPPADPHARQLWQLWRDGNAPPIRSFLDSNGAIGPESLIAILQVDQSERWAIGEKIPVESYLADYGNGDLVPFFSLVLSEMAIRLERGEAVLLEEYRRRLPCFQEQLATSTDCALNGTQGDHSSETAGAPSPLPVATAETLRLTPDWHASTAPGDDSVIAQFLNDVVGQAMESCDGPDGELTAIGPYRIQRVLARGGMGIIYQAVDTRLKRLVALKMILTGESDPGALRRFRDEAEAVARLQHPNIVQIYEVGEHKGLPFLALEYVDGTSLAHRFQGQSMPPRDAARLLHTLAMAIDFAHLRGIIHCDMKPANVLLTQGGVAKITDFGLAKLRETAESPRHGGEVIGTPNYMAPEQAEGAVGAISQATDVYSLGAILYELLTGQPPFQAGSPMDTLLRVRLQEPIPPTHLNSRLPRDLVTICLKCLRKDRHQRYASAAELAADLQRFLDGRPIQARPVTYAERLWMWSRRHPAISAVITASVLLLIATDVLVVWQWREAEAARRASQERLDALTSAQRNLIRERALVRATASERARMEYQQRLRVAELEFLTADADNARRVLGEVEPSRRGWEWYFLERLLTGSVLSVDSTGGYVSFAFNENNKSLMLLRADGALETRSVSTGAVLRSQALELPPECPRQGDFSAAVFCGDRTRLAAAKTLPSESAFASFICVWDVATGKALGCWRADNMLLRLALGSNGQSLAWCDGAYDLRRNIFHGGGVRLVDLSSKEIRWQVPTAEHSISDLSFSPDGKRLAITGRGCRLRILDTETGSALLDQTDRDWAGALIAWNPNGSQIALQRGHDLTLVSHEGEFLAALTGHRGWIHHVIFSNDGRRLASCSSDKTIKTWDTTTYQELQTLVGHDHAVYRVAISDNAAILASFAPAGRFKIWDLWNGHEPLELGVTQHRDWVPALAFDPRGRWVASGCGDAAIRYWDHHQGRLLRTVRTRAAVECLAVDPSGELLAAGLDRGGLGIWNVQTGVERVLAGHHASVAAIAFHPTRPQLLSGGEDGLIRIWAIENGEKIAEIPRQPGAVRALAIHPDGELLAIAVSDGTVRLWSLTEGRVIQVVPAHATPVTSVVFSPNGETFATANSNRQNPEAETQIRIWRTNHGQLVHSIAGHKSSIWHLNYSPDGLRLASAGEDWTVKLWDPRNGDLLLTLKGHSDDVRQVLFSPDGRVLVSAGDNSFLRFWDATPLSDGIGLRAQWWAQQNEP